MEMVKHIRIHLSPVWTGMTCPSRNPGDPPPLSYRTLFE